VHLVDLAPSGRLVFVETADAMTLASGFEQGAAKAPTADFLHVSESSFYDYCTGGGRTGLDDLVLGGETLVSSGTVFEIAPLSLMVSDPVASLLGVPVDLDSPRLAEILRVYIVEGIGKFVSSKQYPEGGSSRYSQGACIE
jgi:hypothetical protein